VQVKRWTTKIHNRLLFDKSVDLQQDLIQKKQIFALCSDPSPPRTDVLPQTLAMVLAVHFSVRTVGHIWMQINKYDSLTAYTPLERLDNERNHLYFLAACTRYSKR
jgi:hypothetical protein